jgi:hypothetical protein
MIWFGNLNRILPTRSPDAYGPLPEHRRMLRALEAVAERAPQLTGDPLLAALEETGWVDRGTARRLLPYFDHFDPDRHFADYLRRLAFRGRNAADEFRQGIRLVVEEITGHGAVGAVGPEPGIRFSAGEREGVVLAHPEVSFSIGESTRRAIDAAVEEMPDVLVVVAKNFDPQAASQLAGVLSRTGVPGTLVTVNLLLGIRAMRHRYQPSSERVVSLLGTGRPLRSADIARLGDPVPVPAAHP